METTSSSLSIESFSHSWLANNWKPSPDRQNPEIKFSASTSFDAADEASFIEMDPKLPPSRRFSRVTKDFSFDFRTSSQPLLLSQPLADAGELISDGFLIPLVGKLPTTSNQPYNYYNYNEPEDTLLSPEPAAQTLEMQCYYAPSASCRVRCASLRRCKRLSRRILEKYLELVRPLCQRLRGSRSGSRVASIGSGRVYNAHNDDKDVMNCVYYNCSPATSPRSSVAWSSADNWRRSCDSESSIYEAVLHCKRTNGI